MYQTAYGEQDRERFMSDMLEGSILLGKKESLVNIGLDSFSLELQIGKGTFGRVFLAILPETGEKFAMKAIRKDKILETKTLECTKLEMDVLTQINHPFLCTLNYVFQSQLRLYFVMPLLEGGCLRKLFKSKFQPEKVAQFYIAQIIIGIGKLHDNGVAHRDLKLSNVMLDTNGYIKIIDFGLAR